MSDKGEIVTIHTATGGRVEGRVVEETAEAIRVDIGFDVVRVLKTRIKHIEREEDGGKASAASR